jgi:hypothetical protein
MLLATHCDHNTKGHNADFKRLWCTQVCVLINRGAASSPDLEDLHCVLRDRRLAGALDRFVYCLVKKRRFKRGCASINRRIRPATIRRSVLLRSLVRCRDSVRSTKVKHTVEGRIIIYEIRDVESMYLVDIVNVDMVNVTLLTSSALPLIQAAAQHWVDWRGRQERDWADGCVTMNRRMSVVSERGRLRYLQEDGSPSIGAPASTPTPTPTPTPTTPDNDLIIIMTIYLPSILLFPPPVPYLDAPSQVRRQNSASALGIQLGSGMGGHHVTEVAAGSPGFNAGLAYVVVWCGVVIHLI